MERLMFSFEVVASTEQPQGLYAQLLGFKQRY